MLFIVSCHESTTDSTFIAAKDFETDHPGKKLMETYCYSCHSPTASHDERLGPPMEAVKRHYKTASTPKYEFINDIKLWINDPNEQNAKMYGAVRRFGVMPKQSFSEDTIVQIADYMYEYELEKPEWFSVHFNDKMGKDARKF